MADSKKQTQTQAQAPAFAPVGAPPPRVREPVLAEDAAQALATALGENEYVSDGVDYGSEDGADRKAHTQVGRYRQALLSYSLVPEGKTLRSRFRNGFLYLSWGDKRGSGAEVEAETPAE